MDSDETNNQCSPVNSSTVKLEDSKDSGNSDAHNQTVLNRDPKSESMDDYDDEDDIIIVTSNLQNNKSNKHGDYGKIHDSITLEEAVKNIRKRKKLARNNSLTDCCELEDEDESYYMIIHNFPLTWNIVQIRNYVEYESGAIKNIKRLSDESFRNSVQIEFSNAENYSRALWTLNHRSIEGNQITMHIDSESERESDEESPQAKRRRENYDLWKPDKDIWATDPRGLYGLKVDFLRRLGIRPPINKWVHVSNFTCDKTELKEVMSLAGEVVICSVLVTKSQRIGKVMFSHPLEAVQAVSMLNNELFYGQSLQVNIEYLPETLLLPKGLTSVGPGLGKNGRQLRDIVRQYERYVKGQNSSINETLFHDLDTLMDPNKDLLMQTDDTVDLTNSKEKSKRPKLSSESSSPDNSWTLLCTDQTKDTDSNCSDSKKSTKSTSVQCDRNTVPVRTSISPIGSRNRGNSAGSNVSNYMPRPSNCMPTQIGTLPGLNMSNFGRPVANVPYRNMAVRGLMAAPLNTMRGPIPGHPGGPRPVMPGQMPNPVGRMPGHTGHMPFPTVPVTGPRFVTPTQDCVTVEITNLPLTTTFSVLSDKMGQCGQVMSLQLTKPGCAVVKYAQRTQADHCIKTYNNMHVEGRLIKVRYV